MKFTIFYHIIWLRLETWQRPGTAKRTKKFVPRLHPSYGGNIFWPRIDMIDRNRWGCCGNRPKPNPRFAVDRADSPPTSWSRDKKWERGRELWGKNEYNENTYNRTISFFPLHIGLDSAQTMHDCDDTVIGRTFCTGTVCVHMHETIYASCYGETTAGQDKFVAREQICQNGETAVSFLKLPLQTRIR